MLHALDLGNIHQATNGLFIKDFSIRREHRAQFKSQHVRISLTRGLIDRCFFFGRQTMQPRSLKQDRNAAGLNDRVHLLPVESDDVAGLIFDIGSGHKWHVFAQGFSGPSQHIPLFCLAQIVDIAGVHVDRVHQSGAMSRDQVLLEMPRPLLSRPPRTAAGPRQFPALSGEAAVVRSVLQCSFLLISRSGSPDSRLRQCFLAMVSCVISSESL